MKSQHFRYLFAAMLGNIFFFMPINGAAPVDWPITFIDLPISASKYITTNKTPLPEDCQPEYFDPAKTPYHLIKTNGYPPTTYIVDGADESSSMMIDGWGKQGEDKIILPEPFSLTKYEFGCASEFSRVFEIKKNGLRHALYTHISQARFSPNKKTLVLYNFVSSGKGSWSPKRRAIELESKKSSTLPWISSTLYLADVTNDKIVTYGPPTNQRPNQTDSRRTVCIWGFDGHLVRALLAPLQNTEANGEESDDGIGLLPNETTTFYHLAFVKDHTSVLRLQDIRNPTSHRALYLTGSGSDHHASSVGTAIQLDLNGLTLTGGIMKYRTSASGRGDISNDWGPWQTAK